MQKAPKSRKKQRSRYIFGTLERQKVSAAARHVGGRLGLNQVWLLPRGKLFPTLNGLALPGFVNRFAAAKNARIA
jgi:hypothetical protein